MDKAGDGWHFVNAPKNFETLTEFYLTVSRALIAGFPPAERQAQIHAMCSKRPQPEKCPATIEFGARSYSLKIMLEEFHDRWSASGTIRAEW